MRWTLLVVAIVWVGCTRTPTPPTTMAGPTTPAGVPHRTYPVHHAITTTVFWIGEAASTDNANIANLASAWDEEWVKSFGGVDDPGRRHGFGPAGFVPKENPFYFALPYNDFGTKGRKASVADVVPWAKTRDWKADESIVKNRWLRITKGPRTCYAQWEDVGPFEENDPSYVFGDGTVRPKNRHNQHAGLDVSPAVRDYLRLDGMSTVDWQFVEEADVAEGPWRKVVTRSGTRWK